MAKKTEVGGKGKKICPKCDTLNGARQKICTKPGCGHVFIVDGAGPKKAKSSGPSGADLAPMFVLRYAGGNIDKCLKAVEEYNESELGQFISDCGGKKNAMDILTELHTKIKAK